jgi:hypothetical protein
MPIGRRLLANDCTQSYYSTRLYNYNIPEAKWFGFLYDTVGEPLTGCGEKEVLKAPSYPVFEISRPIVASYPAVMPRLVSRTRL